MTAQELRELDAWIAEHVMGCNLDWHRGGLNDTPHCACNWTSDDVDRHLPLPYPHANYRGDGRHLGTFGPSDTELMYYTTDPAAAMDALKKCAEKCGVRICHYKDRTPNVWDIYATDGRTAGSQAETLELAICLFAKQLFSKTAK